MPQEHFRLIAAESAVAVARRLAVAQLGSWVGSVDPDDLATVELLVSELVTNAVRYGKATTTTVELIGTEDGTLVITVEDANPTEPRPQEPGADDEGGRGLLLVDALVHKRGTIRLNSGKKTWVEVRLTEGTASRLRAMAAPYPLAASSTTEGDHRRAHVLDGRIRALRPRPGVGELRLSSSRCRSGPAHPATVGGAA